MHWADTQLTRGHLNTNPYGEHRWFRSYGKNGSLAPGVFWKIRRRAVATFSVNDYEDEPDYRCFLGCNTEGDTFIGTSIPRRRESCMCA